MVTASADHLRECHQGEDGTIAAGTLFEPRGATHINEDVDVVGLSMSTTGFEVTATTKF